MAKGNGAREKVLEYFSNRDGNGQRTVSEVDAFLVWLYIEGYMITPHPGARRATKKKKPYTGPMTAGTTHTARLAQ